MKSEFMERGIMSEEIWQVCLAYVILTRTLHLLPHSL